MRHSSMLTLTAYKTVLLDFSGVAAIFIILFAGLHLPELI